MLRRDFQITTDMMSDELFDVLGRLDCKVVTQARSNQNFLDTREFSCASVQTYQGRVVGIQIRADIRVHTRRQTTVGFDLARFAGNTVHVCCRAAEIRDHAGEARNVIANGFDFLDNRIFGAVLYHATFVLSD